MRTERRYYAEMPSGAQRAFETLGSDVGTEEMCLCMAREMRAAALIVETWSVHEERDLLAALHRARAMLWSIGLGGTLSAVVLSAVRSTHEETRVEAHRIGEPRRISLADSAKAGA